MKERIKKPFGKRIISTITSALMAVSYGLSNFTAYNARADNIAPDGARIVTTPYESSMWYTNGPLGVAGDFHLFAFESITNGNHINGNVATPVYNVKASMFASPNVEVGRLLSVITEEINWNTDLGTDGENKGAKYANVMLNRLTDIFLPEAYEMYMPTEQRWDNMGHMTLIENGAIPYPTNILKSPPIVYHGAKSSADFYFKISSNINADAYVAHVKKDYFEFSLSIF